MVPGLVLVAQQLLSHFVNVARSYVASHYDVAIARTRAAGELQAMHARLNQFKSKNKIQNVCASPNDFLLVTSSQVTQSQACHIRPGHIVAS